MTDAPIRAFIKRHYRHFNAQALASAAEDYEKHLKKGGEMMITLAGAMSTGELGISLAEMIRQDKVHAITCTGANLEEDVFNLVGHDQYLDLKHYRELSPGEEQEMFDDKDNRVTDTTIPESVMDNISDIALKVWKKHDERGTRIFPHEMLYTIIREGTLKKSYKIDPNDSWLVAACDRKLPIFVPGWEDSTLGNDFCAKVIDGSLTHVDTARSGIEYMVELAQWYTAQRASVGFFQIGGGIAGDFPICVVPMLNLELDADAPLWGYFCQISDATTSYGGYSGAVPNEKITWGKIGPKTPRHIIESDASIVAPLVFAYVLGW